MSLHIELGLLVFLLFAMLLGMYVMFMGDSERHEKVAPSSPMHACAARRIASAICYGRHHGVTRAGACMRGAQDCIGYLFRRIVDTMEFFSRCVPAGVPRALCRTHSDTLAAFRPHLEAPRTPAPRECPWRAACAGLPNGVVSQGGRGRGRGRKKETGRRRRRGKRRWRLSTCEPRCFYDAHRLFRRRLLSPALPSPQRLVCPEAGANCGLQLERIVGSSWSELWAPASGQTKP